VPGGEAARLGLGRGGDGPSHLITLTELVLARLPLPSRLGEVEGLRHDRIAEYARLAMLDHCHNTNPRPCTVAEMEDLLVVQRGEEREPDERRREERERIPNSA